jgi:hypothetical protein
MRQSIGLANGEMLVYETQSVGPRHDPYGRTIVTRYRATTFNSDPDSPRKTKDVAWRLVSCALAGTWLEDDCGNKIVEQRELMHIPWNVDAKKAHKLADDYFEAMVTLVTGYGVGFWLHGVWEKRDNARWRAMTPQQRYEYEMCMEADAELLSYAM